MAKSKVIGLHDSLLSACRFVEFDTFVIFHVFMHCFGSFLFASYGFKSPSIRFKGQNTLKI